MLISLNGTVSVVICLLGAQDLKEAGVSENVLNQSPHGHMAISGAREEGKVSLNIVLKKNDNTPKILTLSIGTSAQVTLQRPSLCLPAPYEDMTTGLCWSLH